MESLLKRCETQLSKVQRKPFDELPTVKRFLENFKEQQDGSFTYQDVKLKDLIRGKEISCCVKDEWASTIAGAIGNWLGKEDSIIEKHAVQVINTEGWFCAIEDPDFLYDEIKVLYSFFKSLVENAGHKGNVSTIQSS